MKPHFKFILLLCALCATARAQVAIRISGDMAAPVANGGIIDSNAFPAGTSAYFVRGDYVTFEFSPFNQGAFQSNVTTFTNITLGLWASQNSSAIPFMLQSITNGSNGWNSLCTSNNWIYGPTGSTNQNVVFTFSNAQTSFTLNGQNAQSYWLRIYGVTTNPVPRDITMLEGPITVYDGPITASYVPPNYVNAVTTDPFGNLVTPADFWTQNAAAIAAAIGGGGGGGGSDNFQPLLFRTNASTQIDLLPGTALAYISSNNAVNLTNIPASQLVGTLTAPIGSVWYPHSIWVTPAGSDANNSGTNILSPFATVTNALALATTLGGSNVIFLAPGVYPIAGTNVIPANTAVVGSGQNMTTILPQVLNYGSQGLVAFGNNILLKDFTIGSNAMTGAQYSPFVPWGGTNFLAQNVSFFGDGSCVSANGGGQAELTNLWLATFRDCIFGSSGDSVSMITVPGQSGTNTLLKFFNCIFTNVYDSGFLGASTAAIELNSAFSVECRSCEFRGTNYGSGNYAVGIFVDNANAACFVSGNTYAETNGATPANSYGIVAEAGVLNIIGLLNPAQMDSVGGTVNYLDAPSPYLTGLTPANLTGAGPIPYSAFGPIPATNLDKSLGFYNIYQFGAYGNTISTTNANILISYSANHIWTFAPQFTAADVGKNFILLGGLSTGSPYYATNGLITSFVNNTNVGVNVTFTTPGYPTDKNFTMIYGNDDTPAFQAAVNAMTSNNVGNCIVPPGRYGWFGAFQFLPYADSWAQVVLPNINTNIGFMTLGFTGTEHPNPFAVAWQGFATTPPPTNGAIIYTCGPRTADELAEPGRYCAIGIPSTVTNNAAYGFSDVNFVWKNMTIRFLTNENCTPLNLAYVGMADVDYYAFDNGVEPKGWAVNNFVTCSGLIMPLVNNEAWSFADHICGCETYSGLDVGEHSMIGTVQAIECETGIRIEGMVHDCIVNRFLAQGDTTDISEYGIVGSNPAGAKAVINEYDFEHATSGVFANTYAIYDPNSVLHGVVKYAGVNGGVQTNSTIGFIVGATNLARYDLWSNHWDTMITSRAGFASYDTNFTAANLYNTGALGTTNISGRNIEVDVTTSSATIVKFDNVGQPWDTNSSLTIAYVPIFLQPGAYFTNNGTVTITGQHAL